MSTTPSHSQTYTHPKQSHCLDCIYLASLRTIDFTASSSRFAPMLACSLHAETVGKSRRTSISSGDGRLSSGKTNAWRFWRGGTGNRTLRCSQVFPSSASVIEFRGNLIDAASQEAQARSAATSNSIYVVCDREDTNDDQEEQLASCGLHLKVLMSDNTYICCFEPTDPNRLRELESVRYADVFPAEARPNRSFKTGIANQPSTTHYYVIVPLHMSSLDLAQQVADCVATIRSVDRSLVSV
ncbi:MAG: hypothetical protein M1831_001941 [Alyxoria varia]|nr:MAG: hypothetical protein M1831_001941 [Alyxoria varia]